MNGRFVDSAYAAGWAVVRGMPEPLARRQFDALADTVWARHGKGVARLESNLRRVLGASAGDRQLRRITHLGVRSYFRYWREVFQLPRMTTTDIVARMHCDGEWRIRDAVAAGRGAILVLPHMGNWDHAGAWLAGIGVPFTTVAERLEPESLFARFVEFRESLGMEVIPLTGGERPPTDVLTERLRNNGIVCLVADRDLSHNGIEVQFFGEATRMPAGPALLAATTGAALHPVHCRFVGDDSWGEWVGPEITLPEGRLRERVTHGTQALADAFAAKIAEYPADWHMLQRLWLADLPPRPSAAPADPTTASVR
jgi:phosphatidylinositol dimannoside acyltransferase